VGHYDTGYALWYKRLERGTFKFPSVVSSRSRRVEVKASDLMMPLDGVDLHSVRRQKRYARVHAMAE
jgi:transposase